MAARLLGAAPVELARELLDEGGRVAIELGLTGYREYLGTNRLAAEAVRQLEADGQAEHANPRAHFSDALGCETILLTADEQVVLAPLRTARGTGRAHDLCTR